MAFPVCNDVEQYSTTEKTEIVTELSVTPFSGGGYSCRIRRMEEDNILRRKIKAARLHAGYTQEKLGELIGISKSAVSMWETWNPKKYTKPTLENLQSFSKLTGAPLAWLLDNKESINSDWKEPADIIEFPNGRLQGAWRSRRPGLLIPCPRKTSFRYCTIYASTRRPRGCSHSVTGAMKHPA
jgi:transcriptional regulator with XRE-family HTH domain